jgi:uncharacterized protein YdaU (DUF1376 family)
MSKAWMPLYWGDLVADTMHLGPTEFGIYMRLIAHCWQHGSVPDDNRKLALIAHCDTRLWRRYRPAILEFFHKPSKQQNGGSPCAAILLHTRVTKELLRYAELSNKRKAAAEQMHKLKHASAGVLHGVCTTPSQSQLSKKERSKGVSCETGVKTPRHGVRSADGRFVYFKRNTDEFAAYVNDYLEGTGDEPNATADGRWFKIYGEEEAVAEKGKSNGIISSELEATVKARGWA